MLAKGCFCENPEKMPREPKHDIDTILKLCDAYCDIMEEQWSVTTYVVMQSEKCDVV